MRFAQWLSEVETVTPSTAQSPVARTFKQRLQGKLRSIAAQSAQGKPTEDPEKAVNDLAAQLVPQGDAGSAAELAGSMQRAKDASRPKQLQGRLA